MEIVKEEEKKRAGCQKAPNARACRLLSLCTRVVFSVLYPVALYGLSVKTVLRNPTRNVNFYYESIIPLLCFYNPLSKLKMAQKMMNNY